VSSWSWIGWVPETSAGVDGELDALTWVRVGSGTPPVPAVSMSTGTYRDITRMPADPALTARHFPVTLEQLAATVTVW
jgi:hypothetical protein